MANETPIVVNPDPTVASLGTTFRYALSFIGGILVSKGFLPADADVNAIVGGIMLIGSTGYGIYRTVFNKRQLVVAAEAAPNNVAVVK